MIPTPEIAHLRRKEYADHVYDPAEDTFALMDAIEEDGGALQALDASLCVEIGSGSGCVSAFVARILGSSADINPVAAACTKETGIVNQPILTSLVDALVPRIEGAVDLLLFNPPYVATTDEEEALEQQRADLGGAWAGGVYGTKLLDAMMTEGLVERLLRPGGRFYLVAIRQNDPPAIVRTLQAHGLDAAIVLQRRANREQLFIIRAIRP